MTMITPSYLGETIEYSSLHACRSTLEDPTAVHGKLPSSIKSVRAAVTSKLKKVKLSTTILGYSMAFNNKQDAFHGPKSGVTVFKIQSNGAYKEVYP